MAKIKLKNMTIEVRWSDKGRIEAVIIDAGDLDPVEIEKYNKNFALLLDAFIPDSGLFGFSATNAVATWLSNGFGDRAEIIEYDEAKYDPNAVR